MGLVMVIAIILFARLGVRLFVMYKKSKKEDKHETTTANFLTVLIKDNNVIIKGVNVLN